MGRPVLPTVYAIIADVDPALRTLAVEGSKRYAEVFELIYRRQAARPNEIWQADHTLLDLWVVTPSGKPGRPWLTVIEDDHSRAIAVYAVNLDGRSLRDQLNERVAAVAEFLPSPAPRPEPATTPPSPPRPRLRTYLEDTE